MNLSLYSYLSIRSTMNNGKSTFLIDTGADVSVIKHGKVLNEQIDNAITTNLSGVV